MNRRDVWDTGMLPIAVGAVAGLVTGLLGMVATALLLDGELAGGLLGAVGGGVAGAYLSDDDLGSGVRNAVAADVVSSVLFFVLVLVAYLGYVAVDEGLAVISAIWFSLLYVVFGSVFAMPVAGVSLVIAGISGTVTTLAKRQLAAATV